jgi:flagellar biosynthesis protein FlhF
MRNLIQEAETMQVRKFEATTMRDAISAVKRELGANAVILSTKEIAPDTVGMPKLFEVTAAASVSSKAGAETKPTPTEGISSINSETLMKLNLLSEHSASAKQVRVLESAIYDVKSLVLDLLRQQRSHDNTPADLFALEQTLLASGIERSITAELIRHLSSGAKGTKSDGRDDIQAQYREVASRWLMKRIKIAPKLSNVPGMTNIHVILGTAGSGKSTLVTKIATAVAKKERHSVAIISWDPDKIGGSEQTRIYSKILGIEHVSIARAEELKPAVMKLRHTDLILVDTASRNPTDTACLVDLEIIKDQGMPLEFHVALSATDKSCLQDRAIRHFSAVGISSVAFMKLDETPAWGDIFNASCKWSVPISWLCFSSSPSQIPERANRETLVTSLLKSDI